MTAIAKQGSVSAAPAKPAPQTPPAYDYDLKNAVTANRLAGLWAMMIGYRWRYFGATLTLAVGAGAKTATYLLLRYFVDNVLGKDVAPRTLALIALGFIGLALVEGAFTFFSGRFAAQTAEGVARRLRNYLYDHIQRLTFSYHDRMETGELIQRSTSDVDAMRRFYAEQAIGIGRIILLFGINFVVLAQLNLRLAVLSVIVVPVVVVMSYVFFKRISRAYEKYQEQEATLSTVLQENLSGVRVVKAFARQGYERDKFERENAEKYKRGRTLALAHSLFWPLSDILCGAQMLFGYALGAMMTINGQMTVGTYLAYAGLLVWIIFPMRNLGRLIVQMSTGMVSYRRVIDVISQDREPLDEGSCRPEGQVKGDIEFKFVSFGYDPTQPVLSNINLKVRGGEAVALLGSTGSGKTTLVNLLPRFYEYTDGAIKLDGVELTDYPRTYLRSQIGIVEQEPFLFSKTIRDNIKIGVDRPVVDDEVVAAAKAAAIHDSIMTFPEGYDTLVGERGVTLSGGQKQRVAIARTLLKNPRILILDDSTSSVDMETEAEIRAALETLMEGRTTFIIAHRVQSLMNADQIVVMDKGQIVQHGTHETLLREDGLYRQIYDLQAKVESELQEELSVAN
jgi:ATP-binding cassette, subfamily B, bacterial